MALTFTGRFTCSVQDLANIMSTTVANIQTTVVAGQTNANLSNTLYTNSPSPFVGLVLIYTTGATIAAGDTITIELGTGNRSGYNARRLSTICERIQNFASSGFIPSTAPAGRIDRTL